MFRGQHGLLFFTGAKPCCSHRSLPITRGFLFEQSVHRADVSSGDGAAVEPFYILEESRGLKLGRL